MITNIQILIKSILIQFVFTVAISSQEIIQEDLYSHWPDKEISETSIYDFHSPDALFKYSSISDFRVNEHVGNSAKNFVKSAINVNGNSIVVWSDYREGSANVYAQLINSDGTLVGDNIKINSPEDGKIYNYPDVAVIGENNFLIVWVDWRDAYAIYGQQIDENGVFIGENYKIDDYENRSYKYYTSIASNGENFVVSWLDGRNGYNYDIYAQRLDKLGNRIGENFIVNSDSQAVKKISVDVALNSNEDILATWYSNVDGVNQIYSITLDESNNPKSPQIQVSEDQEDYLLNLSPAASNSNEGFLIVWARYLKGDYNILAQKIDDTGVKSDSNFIVNDNLTSTQNNPDITSNSSGKILVTWYDYRDGNSHIYSQAFDNNTIVGENIKVTEDEMVSSKFYVSCAINEKGKSITAWRDLNEPTEYQIYSKLLTAENLPVAASIRVDNDRFSSSEQYPNLVAFDDGTFIIIWSDYRNRISRTYFQRYDENGVPIGENNATKLSGSQYYPGITKLSNNNFLIFWREYTRSTFNQDEIVAQKYFANGEKIGDEFVISDQELNGSIRYVDGASNENGDYVIAWEKRVGSYYRIYTQKYDRDGNAVGKNILVTKDTLSSYFNPKLGIDSNGNYAIAYSGNSSREIFLQRYNNAGIELDTAVIVSTDKSSGTVYNPDISINEIGDCIVIWYENSARGVYFQKFNNIGSEDEFMRVDSNRSAINYNISLCLPDVFINKKGQFGISWNERDNPFQNVKMKLFGSDLEPMSDVLFATENLERNQLNQDIYVSENRVYNVWQDNHEPGVGYDIWANVFEIEDLITDVEDPNINIPTTFNLSQNYPNPFNPTTKIKYSVAPPQINSFAKVNIKIYDVLGKEVRTLVNKFQIPGEYELEFNAEELSSGIYFYTMNVGEFSQTKKMILLK